MRKAADSILRLILLSVMIIPLILAFPLNVDAQGRTPEQRAAFAAINETEDLNTRLEAVEAFIQKWPESGYVISCLQVGLRTAAEIDPESDLVIDYAERYITAYSSRGEALAYSAAASMLNSAGAHADKVDEYIARALEGAEEIAPRSRVGIFMNAATIADARGVIEKAISLQRQALELNPGLGYAQVQLANYLVKANQLDEAEAIIIAAIIRTPDDQTTRETFEDIVTRRTSGRDTVNYRERILSEGADKLLTASENETQTKQMIAVAFAKLGILIDRAEMYAGEIIASTGPEAGGAPWLGALITVAQVRSAIGDHQGALDVLEPARTLAIPYDFDYHIIRGTALEALGRNEAAIDAYLQTVVHFSYPPVMELLTPLWEKMHPGEDLEGHLTALREEFEAWHPESTYEIPADRTGKVVLAELFTGAECPPCVASDLAYDGLIAYYPNQVAAVLVHHLHIPGPDPMTNKWTVERQNYYGTDVVGGTPTSIIDGTDVVGGGGGASVGKGRFGQYSWSIERHLTTPPRLSIDLQGHLSGNGGSVNVSVEVGDSELVGNENLRLRIALAEKELHYEGGNGVAEHRMVVRTFIGGHDGFELRPNGKARVRESLDLTDLQETLLDYLNEFESENADRFRSGPGFSRKMHEIDREQLVLVAFVQNDETKEVYQTRVIELR